MYSNVLLQIALGAAALCLTVIVIYMLILNWRGRLDERGKLMLRNLLVIAVIAGLGAAIYLTSSGHGFYMRVPKWVLRP